jgi:membrane protease YdiL (CAAX protease family)
MISKGPTQLFLTRIPDSWTWMWKDLLIRLLPFTVAFAAVYLLASRPGWAGLAIGRLDVQLFFGLLVAPLMFVAASGAQLLLTRRRRALSVPAGGGDAWVQAGFYALNGPIEEAIFRGLIQGGVGAAFGMPAGFAIGTAAYVLYHRMGWPWADTLATALVGIPLGLAFWLLPGPPSLIGVSIAHIGATCGFLGPGPYVLRKLKLV